MPCSSSVRVAAMCRARQANYVWFASAVQQRVVDGPVGGGA